MTPLTQVRGGDAEVLELSSVDATMHELFGQDESLWTDWQKDDYMAAIGATYDAFRPVHPVHPRKASAGSRRHHLKYLPWKLSLLVPGAVTVLVTPVMWTDAGQSPERNYQVHALDAGGLVVERKAGATDQVVALLQGAWPGADWDHCQEWCADGNCLKRWTPDLPEEIGRCAS